MSAGLLMLGGCTEQERNKGGPSDDDDQITSTSSGGGSTISTSSSGAVTSSSGTVTSSSGTATSSSGTSTSDMSTGVGSTFLPSGSGGGTFLGSSSNSGEPGVIPPNITDCTINNAGCLEAGETPCLITLDETLTGSAATVQADGTLFSLMPFSGHISIWAFALEDQEPLGVTAYVDLTGTTLARALRDRNYMTQAQESWQVAEGDVAVSATASFDNDAGSASLVVVADGAPKSPLESDALGTTIYDNVVIEIWQAEVCNISLSQ